MGYYLRQRYGSQVTTEFVNLAQPDNRDRYSDVLDAVREHKLPLPIVAVNGEVKVAGGVDYYAISRAVDNLLGTAQAA